MLDSSRLIWCWHSPGMLFSETDFRSSPIVLLCFSIANTIQAVSIARKASAPPAHMDALGSVSGSKYSYFCTAASHGALSSTWAASATWLTASPSVSLAFRHSVHVHLEPFPVPAATVCLPTGLSARSKIVCRFLTRWKLSQLIRIDSKWCEMVYKNLQQNIGNKKNVMSLGLQYRVAVFIHNILCHLLVKLIKGVWIFFILSYILLEFI